MTQNNARLFIDTCNFIDLDESGTVNNIITIGTFDYGVPSNSTNRNPVYCSFKGNPLPQITEDKLDEAESEDSFCYISLPNNVNIIKLAVNKTDVESIESAKKYIQGLLVDYQLAHLTKAGTSKEPLYEITTYLSDGTLVSPTIACAMPDIIRKITALETNLDINKAGYYKHVIQSALVQK